MALTVETGAGVAGANTYATIAQIRAYAAARGVALSSVDADVEVLAVKAVDFLETLRDDYQGTKTDRANPLQWPRYNVVVDGEEIAEDEIPSELIKTQCQLAIDAYELGDLIPRGTGREVIEETVAGATTTKYAPSGATTIAPDLVLAMSILSPLLSEDAGEDTISVGR